jgi:proteasome lid subunit RPN8/RPN11
MNFRITSGVRLALIAHAARGAPNEACGLLLGRGDNITRHVEAANVAADPVRRFEIDPAVLLRTHREARGAGEAILGWYHSHPNGQREPSETDAARAVEDGKLWVIVAAGALTGWLAGRDGPVHGRFCPVDLA